MSALDNIIHEVRGPLRFEHLLTFSLHCNHTRSLDHNSFSCLQDLYLTSSLQENQSKGLNTDTSLSANPYIRVKYGCATKEGLCLIRDLSQRVIYPLCSSSPSLSLFLVIHSYCPSFTLRCQSLLPISEVILHHHNYYDKKHNN